MANSDFQDYDIHRTLVRLIRRAFTGSVTLSPHKRKLFFENGSLVYANSDVEDEGFAEILTEMNVISEDILAELKRGVQPGISLGKKIREDRLASPQELAEALKQQIMRVVTRIVNTREGSSVVASGSLPPKIPKLKIHTLPLFVKSFLLVEDPEFPAEVYPNLRIRLTSEFESTRHELNLPDEYMRLLDELSGSPTIESLTSSTHLDLIQIQRLAYTLNLLGAVNLIAEQLDPIEDEVPGASVFDDQTTLPGADVAQSALDDTFFGRLPVTSQDLEPDEGHDPLEDRDIGEGPLDASLFEREPKRPDQDPVAELNRMLGNADEEREELNHLADQGETVPDTPVSDLLKQEEVAATPGPLEDYNADDLIGEDPSSTEPMPVPNFSKPWETAPREQGNLREKGFILPDNSKPDQAPERSSSTFAWTVVILLLVVGIVVTGFLFRDQIMQRFRGASQPEVSETDTAHEDGSSVEPLEASQPEVDDRADDLEQFEPAAAEDSVASEDIAADTPDIETDRASAAETTDAAPAEETPVVTATPLSQREIYRQMATENHREIVESGAAFAVAFVVACEMETLDAYFEALPNDPELRILIRKIGNRDCFIAMYGLHDTREQAEAAMSRLPEVLISPTDPPWIILLEQYL